MTVRRVSPQIHVLTDLDIEWPFSDQSQPQMRIGMGRYIRAVPVDPFPCYAHSAFIVTDELDHVQSVFPLPESFRPVLWIMNRERFDRTNAWTQYDEDYDAPQSEDSNVPRPWIPSIAFQGKRIPPHPAMTRHLVSHEYGHVVERWIAFQRGLHLHQDDVLIEYAGVRGMDYRARHSSGRDGHGMWTAAPAEVFADDFRVLVSKRELEYWPHPEVPRPDQNAAAIAWWNEQQLQATEVPS